MSNKNDGIEQFYSVAIRHMEDGNYEKAVSVLKEAANQFGNELKLCTLLAHNLIIQDDLKNAAIWMKRAQALDHSSSSVKWNEARLLLKQGKFNEAYSIALNAYKFDSRAPEGLALLATCSRLIGNFEECVNLCVQALKLDDKNVEALINRGLVYLSKGDRSNALIDLAAAHRFRPHIHAIWEPLTSLKIENQDFSDAVSLLELILNKDPANAKQVANLAYCYQRLGDFSKAIELYEKSLSIDPNHAGVYSNLGVAYQVIGKTRDSIFSYNRAIEIEPENAEIHNNLGNALKQQGNTVGAISAYKRSLAISPRYSEALYNLGNVLRDIGNLDDAIRAYDDALDLNPVYVKALNNKAIALKDQGKIPLAITTYRKAMQVDPNNEYAAMNLAILLYEKKEFKEASMFFADMDSSKSQTNLLKCYFDLKDKKIFFDQLDYLIDRGENNCVIGSLISRAEVRYHVKRNNPFCNAPLDYVRVLNLKELCNFEDIFVSPSLTVLQDSQVNDRRQGHLDNGLQTSGDVFKHPAFVNAKVKETILIEISKYINTFHESNEGLIADWPTNYELQGWLVSMKSGGSIAPHIHDNGWISGSVYINVPAKKKSDSGNLVVSIASCEDGKMKGQDSQSIDVVTGSLCLFPSSLLHHTIPFESEEERVVLAFDLIPYD